MSQPCMAVPASGNLTSAPFAAADSERPDNRRRLFWLEGYGYRLIARFDYGIASGQGFFSSARHGWRFPDDYRDIPATVDPAAIRWRELSAAEYHQYSPERAVAA